MTYKAQTFPLHSRRLEIFCAVAEAGSLTRAAGLLALSQPAVTRELRALERDLGTVLVDRLPRGVRLTEAGRVLLEQARKIASLERDTLEALDELATLARGRLELAASNTIGNYVLPRVIAAYHQAYPRVTINLHIVNSSTVLNLLSEERVAAGFIEGPHPRNGDFEVEILTRDELVPLVSSQHPLAASLRHSLREVLAQVFLMREEGSGVGEAIRARFDRLRLRPVDTLTLGTTEAIKDVLLSGIGVSILPRMAVSTELAAGRLIILPIPKLVISRNLVWLRPRDRRPSAALSAFRLKLDEAIGARSGGEAAARSSGSFPVKPDG
jgi:DNA-binding transcriptional LysR family regulator